MTEEEIKAKRREYNKKWREAHPGYNREYMRKYVANNREAWNEYCKNFQREHKEAQNKRVNDYHQSKEGRATNLFTSYRQADAEKGFNPDESNLTRDDIVRICFSETSKCVYCGETDWRKLGLDRLDRNRPHEIANVLCSCRNCNVRRGRNPLWRFLELNDTTFEEWMEKNDAVESDGIVIKYPEK